MRTLYEVTANGSTVYNGDDETKANQTRTNWRARGYKVEFLSVDVPDIGDGEPAETPSDPDEVQKLRAMVEHVHAHADELAVLIPSACFALETVAHLRGMERQLLPMTIRMRAILAGKAVKS
jgi:hypothetical protein